MRKIKDFLKTIIPSNIITLLIKLKNCIRYSFVPEKEKAFIRFFASDSENRKTNMKLNDNEIIFDIGGFEGDYTDKILKNNQNVISYIFEPVLSYAQKIKKRFSNNKNVKVFNFGLSDKNQKLKINIQGDGSSFIREFDSKERVEISEIQDIHNFIKVNNISEIGLMKINIEGSEYPLLERLIETNDILKVKRLLIQFHYVDEGSYSKMVTIWKKLEKTHKLIWYFRPYIWEYWELQ